LVALKFEILNPNIETNPKDQNTKEGRAYSEFIYLDSGFRRNDTIYEFDLRFPGTTQFIDSRLRGGTWSLDNGD